MVIAGFAFGEARPIYAQARLSCSDSQHYVVVAPAPCLVGLNGPDDRVARLAMVYRGVSTVVVRPAGPSPATDVSYIEVVLTEPDVLRITVQRENSETPVVTVLADGAFAAGTHRLRIDRPASAPGLLQVVVQGTTFSTVGDVRFQ